MDPDYDWRGHYLRHQLFERFRELEEWRSKHPAFGQGAQVETKSEDWTAHPEAVPGGARRAVPEGKPANWCTLDRESVRSIAEANYEGDKRYGPQNWVKGLPASDLLNHAMEHLFAMLEGDNKEDHLGHAMWNLGKLRWMAVNKPEMIDVPRIRVYFKLDPIVAGITATAKDATIIHTTARPCEHQFQPVNDVRKFHCVYHNNDLHVSHRANHPTIGDIHWNTGHPGDSVFSSAPQCPHQYQPPGDLRVFRCCKPLGHFASQHCSSIDNEPSGWTWFENTPGASVLGDGVCRHMYTFLADDSKRYRCYKPQGHPMPHSAETVSPSSGVNWEDGMMGDSVLDSGSTAGVK